MTILNPRNFDIEYIPSPNKTHRLFTTVKPEVILVHATVSKNISGTISWFQNPDSEVSSDFVIGKDGRIVRMVPKTHYAWHAGVCTWHNQPFRNYNALSYGIELVNLNDGLDPYPGIQLEALAYVCAVIQTERPLVRYLRRHAGVAIPVGRKSDPAGLSSSQIYSNVRTFQPDVILF